MPPTCFMATKEEREFIRMLAKYLMRNFDRIDYLEYIHPNRIVIHYKNKTKDLVIL
ncbi:MAG: hypothetical protein QXG39_04805 [Candidatus Aenigmatarchaeota archaeon]